MKRKTAAKLVYALGMIAAVGAPAISFLLKFPILKERNYDQAVSWFAIAMLALCCVPFFKKIREYFKSPDSAVMWLCIFVVFALIEPIVSSIKLVAFCGLLGNIFAKIMFFVSKKIAEKEDTVKTKEERDEINDAESE